MESANPHMLVIGRESRGLSQSALADLIHVAQGTISKAETGSVTPSPEIVEKYAASLKYPIPFFFQKYEPRNLPVTFFRKRQSLGMYETRRIAAESNIVRFNLHALMQSVEVTTKSKGVPRINLKDYGDSPEAVARELRVAWNVQPGPIKNLTDLLEAHGIFVVESDFGSKKVSGLSLYDPDDPMQLPPVIVGNKDFPPDHWRFTLAHELAHIILHHHLPLPPMECEPEADRFASEFLTPTAEVRGHLDNLTVHRLTELKAYWKVSMVSLIQKAFKLDRITDFQRKRLYQQLASLGYSRTNEPVRLEAERPRLLKEVVRCHMESLSYDADELAAVLRLDVDEFRAKFSNAKSGLRVVR